MLRLLNHSRLSQYFPKPTTRQAGTSIVSVTRCLFIVSIVDKSIVLFVNMWDHLKCLSLMRVCTVRIDAHVDCCVYAH